MAAGGLHPSDDVGHGRALRGDGGDWLHPDSAADGRYLNG